MNKKTKKFFNSLMLLIVSVMLLTGCAGGGGGGGFGAGATVADLEIIAMEILAHMSSVAAGSETNVSKPAGYTYTLQATCGTISQTNNNVSWLAPDTPQSCDITITVDDGVIAGTGSITVNVTAALNTPPTVTITAIAQSVDIGAAVNLNASASDPDGDILTYSWTATCGTIVDASLQGISWTAPDVAGSCNITVVVSDGTDTSSDTFIIKVSALPMTVFIKSDILVIDRGAIATLEAVVGNDGGAALTYIWSSRSPACATFSGPLDGSSTFWTAPDLPGQSCELKVDVDNGITVVSDNIILLIKQVVNAVPEVTIVADSQSVVAASVVSLIANGSDADGDSLTYTWNADCGVLSTINSSTTSWTAPATAGNCNVSVEVSDGSDASIDSTTIIVTAIPNNAPVVALDADRLDIFTDETVNFTATASDADGDSLSYIWTDNCGSIFNDTTSTLIWSPPATAGSCVVAVNVTDGITTESAILTVNVRIRLNNAPNVQLSASSLSVGSQGTVTLTATANDADGDPLVYTWIPDGNCGNITVDNGSTASWQAPILVNSAISCGITVSVTDGQAIAQDAVTVTAENTTNNRPKVSLVSDSQTVVTGGVVSLTANATDLDGDPLTYSWSSNATVQPVVGTPDSIANWIAPDVAGIYNIIVAVSDGTDTSNATETITVNDPPNNPPTVSLASDVSTLFLSEVANLTATANDSDGDSLSYSWSDNCGSLGVSTISTNRWTAPGVVPALGYCTVTVTVSDGTVNVSGSVGINVAERSNLSPTVTISTPDASPYLFGSVINLTANASDPESDTLTYLWSAVSGSINNINNPNTTWTAPGVAGLYVITGTVNDGNNPDVSDSITINVQEQATVNNPPTVTIHAVPSIIEIGGVVNLSTTSDDVNGDTLSFVWSASCGTIVNANSPTSTWTAPAGVGSCTLTVTVNDGIDNGSDSTPVTVVLPPNQPPTVTLSAGLQTVEVSTGITLTANGDDPDGDNAALTYLWSATCGVLGDGSTGTNTWTAPAVVQAGTCDVSVTVNDGQDTASDIFNFTVVDPPNNPPMVDLSASNLSGYTGASFTIILVTNDADSDPLIKNWSVTCGTLNGTATRWIAPGVAGSCDITVDVFDGTDTVSDMVTIIITEAPNNPPQVSLTPQLFAVITDQQINMNANATDADGDSLFYSWSASCGNVTNIDDPHTMWAAPSTSTTCTVSVQVTDLVDTATATVDINISLPPNNPYVQISTDTTTISTGAQVSLTADALSFGIGTVVTFDWAVEVGCGTLSGNQPTMPFNTWTAPDSPATCTVTVTATGGGFTDSDSLPLTVVTPPNLAPEVTLYPQLTASLVSDVHNFTATATDPEGDLLNYTWTSDCLGIVQNGNSAVWTAPATSGACNVNVAVYDGTNTTNQAAVINVYEADVSNNAPTVTMSASTLSGVAGGFVDLSAVGSDPDGDPLDYVWNSTCGSINPGTDTAIWQAPELTSGACDVSVTVYDNRGGSFTDQKTINFILEIKAVESESVLDSTGLGPQIRTSTLFSVPMKVNDAAYTIKDHISVVAICPVGTCTAYPAALIGTTVWSNNNKTLTLSIGYFNADRTPIYTLDQMPTYVKISFDGQVLDANGNLLDNPAYSVDLVVKDPTIILTGLTFINSSELTNTSQLQFTIVGGYNPGPSITDISKYRLWYWGWTIPIQSASIDATGRVVTFNLGAAMTVDGNFNIAANGIREASILEFFPLESLSGNVIGEVFNYTLP